MNPRLRLTVVIVPLTVAVVLGLACRPDLSSSVTGRNATSNPITADSVAESGASAHAAKQAPVRTSRIYTPAELHRRNPADWVGDLHTFGLRVFVAELKKPHANKFQRACVASLAAVRDAKRIASAGISVPANWQSWLARTPLGTEGCDQKRPTARRGDGLEFAALHHTRSSFPGILSADSITAVALVNQAIDAANQAANPTQLAALLSPILDASFALEDTSAALVQATVAETQSSGEYWYADNYTAMEDVTEAEHDDLVVGCYDGTYQGESFVLDNVTYTCNNGDWWASEMARHRGSASGRMRLTAAMRSPHVSRAGSEPSIQFARTALPFVSECEVSNGALYAGIVVSDAIGAVAGALRGWPGGVAGILVFASYTAIQTSAYGAWAGLGVRAYCRLVR